MKTFSRSPAIDREKGLSTAPSFWQPNFTDFCPRRSPFMVNGEMPLRA
jgi:hypothetical protein